MGLPSTLSMKRHLPLLALALGFAMLTRIGLLFSITWLATLRATLFTVFGNEISGRDLILFGGGLFLITPGYIGPLFTTPTGQMVALGAACSMGLGIFIMNKIATIKV